MSKRVLITGAFGQLGDALIMELQPHFKLCATGKEVPSDNLHICKYSELDITKKKSKTKTSIVINIPILPSILLLIILVYLNNFHDILS